MAEIIQLPLKAEQPDEHKKFFEGLEKKADQLIYFCKDVDGNYSMGHTPLDIRELMFMEYHLHKIIHTLVEEYSGE